MLPVGEGPYARGDAANIERADVVYRSGWHLPPLASAASPMAAKPVCLDQGNQMSIEVHPNQPVNVGTLVGGVAGGVIGHQIGGGRGNTAATIAGAIGGAAVGNEIEKSRCRVRAIGSRPPNRALLA